MKIFEDKNKMKKIISTVTLVCIGLSALIGLVLLFKVIGYSKLVGNLLLSILTVFIVGICLINAIESIFRKNKFGIATAIMIIISALLVLVWIWLPTQTETAFADIYSKIVIIVSMISIMLNVIVGNSIISGKKLLFIQIICGVTLAYIEVVVSLAIFGNYFLIESWQIFVACIIVFLTLFIMLRVKVKGDKKEVESDHLPKNKIIITKEEYDSLKQRITDLNAEIEQLKNQKR